MELINGITILSQSLIDKEIFVWNFGSIFFLFAICISVIGGVSLCFYLGDSTMFFTGLLLAMFLVMPFLICGLKTIETESFEYKVMIDSNVSFNEFIEKFDIVNQEGLIYTIRIRDKGDKN